ncbi:hypothetical protein C0581_01360 [Candidatus Parcubacteria bacterium]|nr:MAG: hypothetical protein C0581_01360 [Candidatus Parcubacteria bacterium]
MEQEIKTLQKKKWYRKKLFYILAVVGLLLAVIVYGNVKKANQPPTYETVMVERGVLSQTVDAAGNIESADELDLRFETGGRLGKIYKQTNAEVKAGDIIAELQLGELNGRVAQASASVNRAKANLDKVLAGETDAYVSNIKAQLDQAKANLDKIKATYSDTVANAQAALETAESNLELSEGGEDSQIVQNAYDDTLALLLSVQTTLSGALNEADNILGIDNTFANDEYEDVLSTFSPSKLNSAKTAYNQAKSAKSDVDKQLNLIGLFSTHKEIDDAADTTEEALVVMKDLLFKVSEVLDATIPIGNLSQTELTALKTAVATDRGLINTDYTSLVNQLQAIETAKSSYSTYNIAYNQALSNFENAKLKSDADVAVYQALVDQAQATYDDAKNPARDEDVASARAQLAEAYGSLSQAVAVRNKGRIIAPVDGVVGKINGKVGEYVGATDIVAKLVSPHFEVSVDIPETDIIKISSADEAEITIDAYGNDVKFSGRVSEIEIGETVIQDVIYYTVTVSLEDKDEEYNILNGMTADVLFYTEEKEDVLYVPQRVVRTNDEGKYVRVLEGGEAKEMSVVTGLRGDGGFVEIVSGVEEGQEIIIREVE